MSAGPCSGCGVIQGQTFPREEDWLAATLERGQVSLELRAAVSWLHPGSAEVEPSSAQQEVKEPSSGQLQEAQGVLQPKQIQLQPHSHKPASTSVELRCRQAGSTHLPTVNLLRACWD